MVMKSELSNHHRDTLQRILSHPASGNIEWRQVLSLLNAVGTVDEEHNGKFKVTLGPETEVLERPRGKDIDVQMVVDLRRMLSSAGLGAAGGAT
jgi:dUTPase